ncbi:MAG: hypothetical protein LHW64_05365 [Candidatus Cloacimonetes bacterium]|jgi:hypothetical protein|nr:hypothetical protein [Candidatus Cloacimonadota bacterium]MCB5287211.1 hypothetical protein [Candidatus Cloacimonadota bacterium]MCK9184864.1 hypothetical protein [Candidatus Cloacimonadota bacterium]MDY0229532.1 hypothetical protein [Candidatus Cloacimonadaceae bacterium]
MKPAFFILLIVVSSLVVTVGALGESPSLCMMIVGALGESPNLRIVIKGGFGLMPRVHALRFAVIGARVYEPHIGNVFLGVRPKAPTCVWRVVFGRSAQRPYEKRIQQGECRIL